MAGYASRIRSTPGLVAFWRLGEASGTTANDASGNGRTGTYIGGVTLGTAGAIADGSKAVSLASASSQRMDVPIVAALKPTGAFSFEVWVTAYAGVGDFRIGGHGNVTGSGGHGYILTRESDNSVTLAIHSSVANFSVNSGTTKVSTSGFSHVVGTYDGNTLSVYVNGVRTASVIGAVTIDYTNVTVANFTLGTQNNLPAGAYYNGSLDEAAFYSRALSIDEVLDHYSASRDTAGLLTLTIASVDKTGQFYLPDSSGDVSGAIMAGARGSFRLKVYDLLDAAGYRPSIDDTIAITYNDGPIFAGRIDDVDEGPLSDLDTGIVTNLTASDWHAFCDQVTYSIAYNAGTSLKTILTDLVASKLSAYGITLDAAQATGPLTTSTTTFDKQTLTAILNRLQVLTGWVYRIDAAKKLRMIQAGTVSCGYSLGDATGAVLGTVGWRKSRATNYVNKVLLKLGTEQPLEKTTTMTGNGVIGLFPLDYTPIKSADGGFILSRGYVSEAGVNYPIGKYLTDDVPHGGTCIWTYDPPSNQLVRQPALGNLVTATFQYQVQFPITVSYENTTESAAHGVYEATFDAADVFDKNDGLVLATALARRGITTPKMVTVRTNAGIAVPGQTVALSFAARAIAGTYMITAVDVSSAEDGSLEYTLTCLEGTELAETWLDYFRTGSSGSATGSGGGTVSGALIPGITGQFAGAVSAWSGLSGQTVDAGIRYESSLDAWINATVLGPALCLGRGADKWQWAIVANTQYGATPGTSSGLEFVAAKDSGTYRMAMSLRQADIAVAGDYYLLPGPVGTLHLGGPAALFSNRRITSISAIDINTNGIITALASGLNSHTFGASLILQPFAVNNCWLSDNIYYDGSYRYKVAGGATMLYFLATGGGGGRLDVQTAAAGTAGAVATLTTRFNVNANGNIGFNTSTFGTTAAGVLAIANGVAPTTSPAGLGQLYVAAGALVYRGSAGTVTTLANA